MILFILRFKQDTDTHCHQSSLLAAFLQAFPHQSWTVAGGLYAKKSQI